MQVMQLYTNIHTINMTGENVLTDNRLLFLFSKIYGFVSLEINEDGRCGKKVEVGKFNYFFAICFQIAMHITGLLVYMEFYDFAARESPRYILFVVAVISHSTYYLCCLGICLFSIINAQQNKKYWQDLYATEMALRKNNIMLNHKSLRKAVHLCTAGMILLLLPAVALIYYNHIEIENVTFLVMIYVNYHYTTTAYIVLIFQHILLFNAVVEMFGKLEDAARQEYLNSKRNSHVNHRYLLEIAKCHQMVCEVARFGNSVISIPLALEYTHIFCFLTTASFFASIIFMNNLYNIWTLLDLVWVTIILTVSAISITISHTCMKKVSLLCLCYLYTLLQFLV